MPGTVEVINYKYLCSMDRLRLEDLGYNDKLEKFRIEQKLESFEIGRVIAEHKERYIVKTIKGEFNAEITGNMRFTAKSREDYPAVGDWVALKTYDSDSAIVHKILPRFSIIKRQAVAQLGEVQVIATNIDYALVVQAVDRDFNINRLERYLTICNSARVEPVIVLTKIDLIKESRINEIKDNIISRIKNVLIIALSNGTHEGYNEIKQLLKKGKTYCLLGSSGVGKSTLMNNISGKSIMRTDTVSQSTNKGKHVTSHRELIVLENGGVLVDNPGMREVGIADTENGLSTTFDKILSLAQKCKYANCTHTNETGCAVLEAVHEGALDKSSYENYQRLEREKAHFESTVVEKRKKDKEFGKMIKIYKKDRNQNKY